MSRRKVEVFEVTLDASSVIKPQERGMRQGRGKEAAGDPHKQIQIEKTALYLAQRFPGVPIVYNIQATGQPPPEVRKLLELELTKLRRALNALGLDNPIQIIWRSYTHRFVATLCSCILR